MEYIKFEDFSAYYKQGREYAAAVDRVNFSIQSGELFVVVGVSGSGKTTLLKSILGLMEYMEGDLLIGGISISQFDVKQANLSYVPQEVTLYPHLTVYENIAFPLRLMHTPQDEVDRRVKEAAQALEIQWLLTRKPRQLSGGQHQRIAIARALIKKPQMILFDEPFSNLEPVLRGELRRLVKNIHQTYGTTMLFVTHDLPEAFFLADRVLVLEEGQVADLGTPEELRNAYHSELLKVYFQQQDNELRGYAPPKLFQKA